jgi:hypothetical protein
MEDYLAEKELPNGRGAWVVPLTYDRARIIVGKMGSVLITDGW